MGAQPLSEWLHCHQGNEVKRIQTTGNPAKALGSESSRACGCCNPSLSAEIGSQFPCICCQRSWLLLAGKKLTQHRPMCYSAFGYTSPFHPKGPSTTTAGAIVAWDFSEPFLTYSWCFPHSCSCHSVLSTPTLRACLYTREILLSVEHISSARRAFAVLSELKRSCAKTPGVQNRCPAIGVQEKRRWNHCSISRAPLSFLCTNSSS